MRVPPQATQIERAILGSLLISREHVNDVFESLSGPEFYDMANREVFECMKALYMEAKQIDLLTVEQKAKDRGKLKDYQISVLSDLTSEATGDIEYCIEVLREKHLKRSMIDVCSKVIEKSYKDQESGNSILDEAQETIFSIGGDNESRTHEIADVMNSVITEISDRLQNGIKPGIPSGLDVDNFTNGFQKGEFYVIAARPSMGKTAFALTIMRNVAKQGINSAVLSLETSHNSLGYRLLSMVSGVSVDDLKGKKLSDNELRKIMDAGADLSSHGIYIDDTLSLSASQLRAKCRSLVQKHKVEMIFIDFLQLLTGDGQNREREVAQISRTCKIIGKELNVAIIALSQLSRAVESRGGDKKPMLSDLRDSGSIEQDAYCVMFLYRPEYYSIDVDENDNSTSNVCEVIIAKNKDGKTGQVRQYFYPEKMKFTNLKVEQEGVPF
jgi:replicative DNA helicase